MNHMAYKINEIKQQYLAEVFFDQIIPNSIFSQSILLILTSLTLTSIFFIILICVLVKNQISRTPRTKRKKRTNADLNPHQSNKYRYIYTKPTDRETLVRDTEKHDMLTPLENSESSMIRKHRKPSIDLIAETIRNSIMRNNKNKSLSLSGPINIKKFEGKPDRSWLNIDQASSKDEGSFKFQGTSDFENQMSSVERAEESIDGTNGVILDIPQNQEEGHNCKSLVAY